MILYVIQASWDPEKGKKDRIMISLGNRWKEFKSKLYREFHLQNKDEVAREKYHIPLHVWDEFVRQRSTPEFQVPDVVVF